MTRGGILEVPRNAVVLLVGAAGAGKSTFARRHFPADAIISSDALRAAITGDVTDQTANGRVFAAVHRALEDRLATGRLAVIDATNLTTAARRGIRERAAAARVPVIAIVLAPAAEVVHRQNRSRPDRRVPDAVVDRHLAALSRLLERDGLVAEGYAPVLVLRSAAEIATIEVRLAG
ncbi:MAG: AAA family ATPase [Chloroflexi bacterium]|nr:AAA family ATPase [Chloroflexota bacterium]